MKSKKDFEKELLMKERRVAYWDVYGTIPADLGT